MKEKPALLLLPNLIGEHRYAEVFLPQSVYKAVSSLDGLIAESESGGRRFLGRFETKKPANEIPIALYNEHTDEKSIDFLLEPILNGERWGFVSDAGLPCVADPGSKLVEKARKRGITVQTFVGPSSIMIALILSGLSGQKFQFHGYLSKEPAERAKQIKQIADHSQRHGSTEIFIEAPYRNKYALEALLSELPSSAQLCVAWDLTLPTQGVVTQSIESWRKSTLPDLEKKPAIFLLSLHQ